MIFICFCSFLSIIEAWRHKKREDLTPLSMCYLMRMIYSVQSHTREERCAYKTFFIACFYTLNCSYKPCTFLLKDILTRNTVLGKKCIQATLCGIRLIPTIEQLNEVLTDSCDLITIQKHTRDITFCGDLSVILAPILLIGDCLVHQGFDLTHFESWVSWFLYYYGNLKAPGFY